MEIQISMNMMKRLAPWAVMLGVSAVSLNAQLSETKFRAEAGVNASKISQFGQGENFWSYRLGGYAVMPVQRSAFSLSAGLLLVDKGEKQTFYENKEQKTDVFSTKTSVTYLQLPLEAVAKIPLATDHSLNIGLGPYFAYALSGKSTNWGQVGKKVDLFDKADGGGVAMFKRFEWGLGVNLSYAYKNYSLKGGLEYSMSDVVNPESKALSGRLGGTTRRFGSVFVTLGYTF